MKNCDYIIILLWLVVCTASCFPHKRRETAQNIRVRTREVIAVGKLIQEYEKEHHQFYKQIRDGNNLGWPDLFNKNLSIYCKKYLQYSNPTRKTGNPNGTYTKAILHYQKEHTTVTSEIIVVRCKVMQRNSEVYYCMTRAPEPNCVYALKCTGNYNHYISSIINKYCDFECRPLINSSLKNKKIEIIDKIHSPTGQFIAKDRFLQEYELELQELHKRVGGNGECIKWPYAMEHHNLDSYCHQYLVACAPKRNLQNVKGSWKNGKVRYQEININAEVNVIIIKCFTPNSSKRHYYLTRAPERNCVFALLRLGCNRNSPFIIVFKYCDFEYPSVNETISHDYNILDKNVVPKTEVKEGKFDILETQKLLPKY